MPTQWYWGNQQSPSGPVSSDGLRKLVAEGAIQPDDLVGGDGVDKWVPARKIKGLFPVSSTPAAPTTPPPNSGMDAIEIFEETAAPGPVSMDNSIEIFDETPSTPGTGDNSIEIFEDDGPPAPPSSTSSEPNSPAGDSPSAESSQPAGLFASATSKLSGFFGKAKQKFSEVTQSGNACEDCGEALGVMKWNHVKKIPEYARPNKEFLCAVCVGKYDINCQTCGSIWRINLESKITSCPTCEADQKYHTLITHKYDEYRKLDSWQFAFMSYRGGLLASLKSVDTTIIKWKLRETGVSWLGIKVATKTVLRDLDYLRLNNLFIKKGDLVVRTEYQDYRCDSTAPHQKFNDKTWTMYENLLCQVEASDLVALIDADGDYAFRLEGSGFEGIDITVNAVELDSVFKRFVDEYIRPELDSGTLEQSPDLKLEGEGSDEAAENVPANPPPSQAASPAPPANNEGKDNITMLKELKELLEMGVLTQEEFDAKKAEILKRM